MSVTQEISVVSRNSTDQLQTATMHTHNYQCTVIGIREREVVQPTATPPNLREKELKYQVYAKTVNE